MRVFPLGDSALTIEFGNEISLELNRRSIDLAAKLSADPFPGMDEAVPAYSSVTVFYDPAAVRRGLPVTTSVFGAVEAVVRGVVDHAAERNDIAVRVVEIPVKFNDEVSLDLEKISIFSGLVPGSVIDIFLSRTYRVYMLGFLPGFAYMGEVDERIAAPRLDTPRTKVLSGSVGIAGRQTGIYPLNSPGGWNIIGRTETPLFDPHATEPCLLRPGNEVRFVKIT